MSGNKDELLRLSRDCIMAFRRRCFHCGSPGLEILKTNPRWAECPMCGLHSHMPAVESQPVDKDF